LACCLEIHTDDPPINSYEYGVIFDSRMLGEILNVAGKCGTHAFTFLTISPITILKNRYNKHKHSHTIFIFHTYSKLTSGSGANFKKYKIRKTGQTQKYFKYFALFSNVASVTYSKKKDGAILGFRYEIKRGYVETVIYCRVRPFGTHYH
jgi:hypothetical protein